MTMLRAAIRLWFTPTMICVLAEGISIRNSCCRRVPPDMMAASLMSLSTRSSPSITLRAIGGAA